MAGDKLEAAKACAAYLARRIQPGGSTNLSGVLKGVEQLRAVPGGTDPKKVLPLTDGSRTRNPIGHDLWSSIAAGRRLGPAEAQSGAVPRCRHVRSWRSSGT
jgi:hypothetical protein